MQRLSSKHWLLLFALIALSASRSAFGQAVEAYGTFNVTHLSQVYTGVTATPNGYQPAYASITPTGLGGGVSLRLIPLPVVSLSLDARGSTRPGVNGQDDALFGLKLSAHLPIVHLRPYIEGAAGYQSTHTANVSPAGSGHTTTTGRVTSHYAVYELLGGVDYPLIPHLDLRLIEVGGGSSFGSSPNTSLYTINSGAVLHF